MDTEMLTESELDARLAQSNPVNRAALDDDGVRLALASVRDGVESRARQQPARRHATRSGFRRWRTKLGMATSAAAIASLVGIETLGGAGVAALPLAVSPAAAAQLTKAAHAAAGQATPGPAQLEYFVTRFDVVADPSVNGVNVGFKSAVTTQDWNAPDSNTSLRREILINDGTVFDSPQDKANYLANKSAFETMMGTKFGDLVGAPSAKDPTATGQEYDYLYADERPGNLTSLEAEVYAYRERPSSPRQLLTELTATFDADPSDLWSGLIDILRDATNAQLRATAYQALKYVPGTTVDGNVTDQLGRPGIEISYSGYAERPGDTAKPINTMIVSPTTGYMLELDSTTTTTGQGTVLTREIDEQRGFVDSNTELPGGASVPITTATRTVDVPKGTISSGPPPGAETTTTSSSAMSTTTASATGTSTVPATSTSSSTTTTPQTTTTNSTATTPSTTTTPQS